MSDERTAAFIIHRSSFILGVRMQAAEYTLLHRLDQAHWFYRGKRAIARHWIARHCALTRDDLLVDAGMGTGTWAVEMSSVCRVLGLDNSDESLAIAKPRVEAAGGSVLKTNLDKVALADGSAAVVTMLDVLEHLDDDGAALREMIRITRPGGLLIVTVPALRWLWSDWDETLGHKRRYHREQFRALLAQPGVDVLRCCYFNSLLLGPIALARWGRKLRPRKPGAARAEDRIPPGPVNALLYALMVKPACWGWFHPPLGVSLLGVLRKQ